MNPSECDRCGHVSPDWRYAYIHEDTCLEPSWPTALSGRITINPGAVLEYIELTVLRYQDRWGDIHDLGAFIDWKKS